MSVKISQQTQQDLTNILVSMEDSSELTRCVVVTRTGIKVAPDMDADTYSASSAALIDLGERVVASLDHGELQELVINAFGGYVILVAVGPDYMLLGSTSAALKMGYYLPYIRHKAWSLENIIYGEKIEEFIPPEQLISDEKGEQIPATQSKPAVSMEDVQAADMEAMNDVLAAFDDFGIDDDFASSLGADAPSVGISSQEMEEINKQLQSIEDGISEATVKTTHQPTPSQLGTEYESADQPATPEDCPIPLEPGEVAPFPLDPSELNPLGEEGVVETPQPATDISESTPNTDMIKTEPTTPMAQPEKVEVDQTASSQPAALGARPPEMPSFEEASEYNFDFGENLEDDDVIPEQDSMADALKALGWEEEEE